MKDELHDKMVLDGNMYIMKNNNIMLHVRKLLLENIKQDVIIISLN